eukprot:13335717-Alexandrium_andersonii.AAC.1
MLHNGTFLSEEVLVNLSSTPKTSGDRACSGTPPTIGPTLHGQTANQEIVFPPPEGQDCTSRGPFKWRAFHCLGSAKLCTRGPRLGPELPDL